MFHETLINDRPRPQLNKSTGMPSGPGLAQKRLTPQRSLIPSTMFSRVRSQSLVAAAVRCWKRRLAKAQAMPEARAGSYPIQSCLHCRDLS